MIGFIKDFCPCHSPAPLPESSPLNFEGAGLGMMFDIVSNIWMNFRKVAVSLKRPKCISMNSC